MAYTPTLLTASDTGTTPGGGDIVTASVAPTGPVLFWAFIGQGSIAANPAISGCGLTWTQLATATDGSSFRRLVLWLGTGTPTEGAITVSEAGGAWDWRGWGAVQISDATANVIVAANTISAQGAAGTGDSLTYPQAFGAGNGGFAVFASTAGSSTPRTGWSELYESVVPGTITHTAIWRADADTIAAATFTSGSSFYGIAVEIEAASAGDTTPPTLSSPTASATGATTASGSVTTDEGNGTLYWYVSTSATPPSVPDLQAGTGAADSGSQAVSTTGAQPISGGFSGLSPSTTYYAHYQQRDAANNDSTVVTSASFTTGAAATGTSAVSGGGTVASTGVSHRAGTSTVSEVADTASGGTRESLGASTVSGGGALAATGASARAGTDAISGGGTLAASGTSARTGTSAVSGGGDIVSAGVGDSPPAAVGTSSVSGGGSLSATGVSARGGTSAVSGAGTLTATGVSRRFGIAAVSGGGEIVSVGTIVGQLVASPGWTFTAAARSFTFTSGA